jgi:signal peptide peptidase SppA
MERAYGYFVAGSEPRKVDSSAFRPTAASGESSPEVSPTAVIPIIGPIAKDEWIEYWGGTSSLTAQARIQAARRDPNVDSILLLVDSPGGEVAGTEELANEVAAAAREMPVHAHIDDLGASAAYWVASQARTISANASALIGSIGAIVVVYDWSKLFEEMGIQVHVVASGDKKAPIVTGKPVTKEGLADLQAMIDGVAEIFQQAVGAGRDLSAKVLKDVSDARIMRASEALELGLIDSIGSRQAAYDGLRGSVAGTSARRRRSAEVRARANALLGRE